MNKYYGFLMMMMLFLSDCHRVDTTHQLSARTADGINVVVEIPAGTNLKNEYDAVQKKIVPDQINGEDRIVQYLPYPGNYGYIPGTLMNENEGGDGDALDVLVISSSVPVGTVIEAMPVAALILEDGGELDTKIIAVPVDKEKRTLQVTEFYDLLLTHDSARMIIENWFLAYKGPGVMKLIRWEDEEFAQREIDRFTIKEQVE